MKKIINGARYDTETAKSLGWWENRPDTRDLYYYSEELFRTKSGKYFLHKEGGAGSAVAEQVGSNEWGFGEQIVPISEEAAQKWAEEHLSADRYVDAFGEPDEDARFTVVLPQSLLDRLDARKVDENLSRSEVVINALRAYL